ncbi:hypothetical protein FLP41_15180 [Paracoccus marcusii]|nr:hypothetical protein FLP41_15180 [Paracoccus marcusii]
MRISMRAPAPRFAIRRETSSTQASSAPLLSAKYAVASPSPQIVRLEMQSSGASQMTM